MIKPLGDRLAVEQLKGDEVRTDSGLIVGNADSFTGQESSQGLVLAVGPDCEVVKVGDKITYGQFAPTRVRDGMKVVFMLSEADVMAVVS